MGGVGVGTLMSFVWEKKKKRSDPPPHQWQMLTEEDKAVEVEEADRQVVGGAGLWFNAA